MQNRIAKLRRELGLSQEQLASASGISRTFLSTVETGAATPTVATASAIAEALGVSLNDLCFEAGSRHNEKCDVEG